MESVDLSLPDDPNLVQAAGHVALVHGQLELMLRMTIKTLSGLTVREALNATERSKNWELRRDIHTLFNNKEKDPSVRYKLKAILGECDSLSEERNRLLHNALAIADDGSIVAKGPTHAWGPAPTADNLNNLATRISEMVRVLNEERLRGFIKEAVKKSKV